MTEREADECRESIASDAEIYRGRLLDTELALWTAILTLNGILVSACSVMIAMMDGSWKIGFLTSIAASLLSSLMIFRNFNRRRYLYRCLSLVPSRETCLDDKKFDQYFKAVRKTKQYHSAHEERNKIDENYAICLLALATLACVATSYAKLFFTQ